MLRQVLLAASRNGTVKNAVCTAPVSRGVVERFTAGETVDAALVATDRLVADGRKVTLAHLGEDTRDRAQAKANRDAFVALLGRLAEAGFGTAAEVSLKLSAVGQALSGGRSGGEGDGDGERMALDGARAVCEAADAAGTTVTLDMEEHTTADSTLGITRELRRDFPWLGVVLQSYLRRTEADCRDFAGEGSRVRLCKGAYDAPDTVAFPSRTEIDKAYVRNLKTLMAGRGHPMIATHDPRLIEIAGALAVRHGRPQGSYEFQMLYGVRESEQRRLAAAGEAVRVYVPYGGEWYAYFMRRLAERPANMAFFLRSLATRG